MPSLIVFMISGFVFMTYAVMQLRDTRRKLDVLLDTQPPTAEEVRHFIHELQVYSAMHDLDAELDALSEE